MRKADDELAGLRWQYLNDPKFHALVTEIVHHKHGEMIADRDRYQEALERIDTRRKVRNLTEACNVAHGALHGWGGAGNERTERDRYLAVVAAAQGFADHVANEDHGNAEGECFGCGQTWPCFVERLHLALTALAAKS